MQAHLGFIEAQGSLALRARAHFVLADALLRVTAAPGLPAVRAPLEAALTRCARHCDAAEWWAKGEEAAAMLALVRHLCGDDAGRDAAAAAAERCAAARGVL